MLKPIVKKTLYTQGSSDPLPILDPVKQEVAVPFVAANKEGKKVAEYLAPTNGGATPPTAAEVRKADPGVEEDDGPGFWDTMGERFDTASSRVSKRYDKINGTVSDEVTGFGVIYEDTSPHLSEMWTKLTDGDTDAAYISLKDVMKAGKNLDFPAVQERIEAALGIPGGLASLSGGMQNNIVNAAEMLGVGDMLGIKDGDLGIINNEIMSYVNGGEYKDVSSIMGLVQRATGANSVLGSMFDVGAQVALINGIADKLIAWGVPEFIDGLLDSMADKKAAEAMYEELCVRAASQGNIAVTEHYGDKMGQGRRTVIAHDVIYGLIRRFTIPRHDPNSDYWWGAQLLRVIIKFKVDWDVDVNDRTKTDLYYYSIASVDSINTLRHTDRRLHAIAGEQTPMARPIDTIRDLFPNFSM